jgi:hypothetical protein
MKLGKAITTKLTKLSEKKLTAQGVFVSLLGHLALLAVLLWVRTGADWFIAAGHDTGSANQGRHGNLIQIELASASELLPFRPGREITPSNPPNDPMALDNPAPLPPIDEGETEPFSNRKPGSSRTNNVITDRAISASTERPYPTASGRSTVVNPGPLLGNPMSSTLGGFASRVGLSETSTGNGIPGGSEYGRRLQQALSSYYRLIPSDGGPRYIVTRIRIARTGEILSIQNGRLDPQAMVISSNNQIIDSRVIGALLELNRNPIPFPPDFLPGRKEVISEIYFQYE